MDLGFTETQVIKLLVYDNEVKARSWLHGTVCLGKRGEVGRNRKGARSGAQLQHSRGEEQESLASSQGTSLAIIAKCQVNKSFLLQGSV
jgi:hypothetical protein